MSFLNQRRLSSRGGEDVGVLGASPKPVSGVLGVAWLSMKPMFGVLGVAYGASGAGDADIEFGVDG